MPQRPPRPTLFPYTTLFRSKDDANRIVYILPQDVIDNTFKAYSTSATSPTGYGSLGPPSEDRKSTRLNSSHQIISYAVFCLKKKSQRTPRAKRSPDTATPAR